GSSTRRSAARLQRATGTPSTCEISSADGVKAICTSCRAAERPSLYRPRAVIASNVAEVEDVEQALAGARHRDAALRDRCEVERAPHLGQAGEESYLPKGDERRRDAEGRDDDREVAERSAQKRPAPHGVGEGEALEGHVRREIALRARLVPDHGKTSRREKEQERQQPPTEQVAAAPVEAQRTIGEERVGELVGLEAHPTIRSIGPEGEYDRDHRPRGQPAVRPRRPQLRATDAAPPRPAQAVASSAVARGGTEE